MSKQKTAVRINLNNSESKKPEGKCVLEVVHGYIWIGGAKKNDQWCLGVIDNKSDLRAIRDALNEVLK